MTEISFFVIGYQSVIIANTFAVLDADRFLVIMEA